MTAKILQAGGRYWLLRADGKHYAEKIRGGQLYTLKDLQRLFGQVLEVHFS